MALAPFFERVYSAVGGHLSVSRDDLTSALENVAVGVKCDSILSNNDRLIAELTTNLLSRIYPRIAIVGSEAYKRELGALAQSINPEIEIVDSAPPEYSVGIGKTAGGASLHPSALGWVARLTRASQAVSGPDNPYASGAAAALAAAELFRRIFLRTSTESDVSVSLLNFDDTTGSDLSLPDADLGDVLFAAVGAVGNAAIWSLARDSHVRGCLTLIDAEQLELSNLQRYVLATMRDTSKAKVDIARHALSNSRLSVDTVPETLESFADKNGGLTAPTVCISVDNIATRRAAQAMLPRLVVNGWTGEKALGVSWHVFSRDASCLACLYQPHGEGVSQTEQAARALGLPPDRAALLWVTRQPLSHADIAAAANKLGVAQDALQAWNGKTLGDLYTDVVCGAAPISLPLTNRTETVPLAHQSALAGILMATELIKRTTPQLVALSQAESLVSWDDILRPPPKIWNKPRARERGCICGDPDYQKTYRAKWESSPTNRHSA